MSIVQLRIIKKDGKTILQQAGPFYMGKWTIWRDIPKEKVNA